MSGEKSPSVSVNIAVANSAAQSLASNVNSRATEAQQCQVKAPSTCAATLLTPSLLTSLLQTQIQNLQKAQSTSQPLVLPTSLASAIQALTKSQFQQVPSSSLMGGQLLGQATSTEPSISPVSGISQSSPSTVKLNVKVINPEKKSQSETYVLRNISCHKISTPAGLKEEILTQFGSDMVSNKLDFPVGYMKGGTKVWIRTESDVQDVWSFVRCGDSVSLWCHGVHIPAASKKSHFSESGSESDDSFAKKPKKKKKKRVSKLDEKNNRVEEVVTNLREKHGTQYTTIQYRLWAEMVDVGTHKSLDDPPRVPIFTGGREKRPNQVQVLTTAVTEMAKAMATPTGRASPATTTSTPAAGISPGKVANLRSNYLQQMRDLHSLFESGAITDSEFQEQKFPILDQLKKLTPP